MWLIELVPRVVFNHVHTDQVVGSLGEDVLWFAAVDCLWLFARLADRACLDLPRDICVYRGHDVGLHDR
jgi:hypothetical protein